MRAVSLPNSREKLAAMTDDDIRYHYRQRNPYVSPAMARELHREELRFWHLGAIQRRAERDAKEKARQQLRGKLFPTG